MDIPIYQVDAFTDRLFTGNPAAVCPLTTWLPDDTLQQVARENNLSETAFFVTGKDPMPLRWFTPTTEVDLCGHATLATAHVLITHLAHPHARMRFATRSGELEVTSSGESRYTLDFPTDRLSPMAADHPDILPLGVQVVEAHRGKDDILVRVASQRDVERTAPDFRALTRAACRGVIVTAEGVDCDYVARCFYPQTGVDEDPATGSSQTTLAPFWSNLLNKDTFRARQLSARGGEFDVHLDGKRTHITGGAVSYLTGTIRI